MKRNPHPARRSRVATFGVSLIAFVSVVSSLAWNTNQAELAANIVDVDAVPLELTTPASSAATPASSAAIPGAPAAPSATVAPAKISPTAPAAPEKKKKAAAPAKKKKAAAPAKETAAPATPVVAPAAPAPSVVYTCMSPGGKTENPTSKGKCKNAKYGYVLTKV